MKITLSAPGTFAVTAAPADAAPDAPERRTIAGIAVPWGAVGHALTGKVRFEAGSLPIDGPAPKLLRDHSVANPIGIVTARRSTDAGMEFEARISATAAGDEALTLAADGVLDSVSVGVDVLKHHYDGDVLVVEAGRWAELSLLPFGAFEAAKVLDVAASAPDEPEPTEPTEPEEGTEMTNEVAATAPLPIVTAGRKPLEITAASYLSAVVRKDSAALDVIASTSYSSDILGNMPEELAGTLWDTLNANRVLISSFGLTPMPTQGETFYRRKVNQHTEVAQQMIQGDPLASNYMITERLQVDKKTFGGYTDVSYQAIDWADTNAVQLVINDLTKVYAKATETYAAATFLTDVTVSDTITDWADGDEIIDKIYTAAGTVNAAVDELPSIIWCSPDRFVQLAQAKAANGDRIFPYLGPSNAAGTLSAASFAGNPLGLRLVVSNRLPVESFVIGMPAGFELFEQRGGLLRVDQPDTWKTRIAIGNYFATCMIDSGAFVKFVDAA